MANKDYTTSETESLLQSELVGKDPNLLGIGWDYTAQRILSDLLPEDDQPYLLVCKKNRRATTAAISYSSYKGGYLTTVEFGEIAIVRDGGDGYKIKGLTVKLAAEGFKKSFDKAEAEFDSIDPSEGEGQTLIRHSVL